MRSMATIASACELVTDGTHYTPSDVGVGVPFLTVKDVSKSGLDFVGCSYITESDYRDAASGNSAPMKGDVLFSKDGTVGKVHVVASERPFAVLSSLAILRPKKDAVDPGYLGHALRSPDTLNEALKKKTGSAIRRIILSDLKRVRIYLPPITEQRRIATILNQADALRAKRREALAQLDSHAPSIFIEMFGDPRENERKWPVAPIGSFISAMRGGAPLEPDDFTDSGFPILHKGAIKTQGGIQVDARKKTFASHEYAASKPNCIADRACVAVTLRDLVPSGPSIGLVADLRYGSYDRYLLAQGAYAFLLNPEKVTAEYFVQLSNMPTFRYVLLQNAVGSTQIHIRTPIYLAITPPVPPIELQNEFAGKVRAIEVLKQRFRTSLVELDSLFASLQHRAFRGEL